MAELADHERCALLAQRLGLPEDALRQEYALEALRHSSALHEQRAPGLRSNERLEFIGDSVLGMVVALTCFERFPTFTEGDLTRVRAALVRADTLAQVARELGLGELLVLGRGAERSGGRDNQNLLADAFEAAVAAVFLSCGLPAARELIDRAFAGLYAVAAEGTLLRDPKTELQEKVQSARQPNVTYAILASPGPDHARTFEVEVSLRGTPLGRGLGRTKKEAEQAAARAALTGDALAPLLAPAPAAAPDAPGAPPAAPDAAAAPEESAGAEEREAAAAAEEPGPEGAAARSAEEQPAGS